MIRIEPAGTEEYAERYTTPLSDLHDRLAAETREKTPRPEMMVGSLEGALLRILARLVQARRILEIGMFTGYSALAWAEALPPDGKLVTCDVDARTAEIARRYFSQSPHGHKIEMKIGPALETLKTLSGPFDICFIDADKDGYPAYYEASFGLVRPGGLIVLDNMLRGGRVLNPSDDSGKAVTALNRRIHEDPRVENVFLPLRDGIMLAYVHP
jgi:caffeoyl-CoA O-methyltransferase